MQQVHTASSIELILEQCRAFLDGLGFGVIVVDAEERCILEVNAAALEMHPLDLSVPFHEGAQIVSDYADALRLEPRPQQAGTLSV